MILGKKRFLKLEKEVEQAFHEVKKDFKKVASWIDFIEEELEKNKEIKQRVSNIEETIKKWEEKDSFIVGKIQTNINKHKQTRENKQEEGNPVQTAVQTAVQTENIKELTTNERMIIWTLLNSENKMSHEDLATILGKNKSTIRGQINTIKKKTPGILEEFLELSGKKRLYIPEKNRKEIIRVIKILKK